MAARLPATCLIAFSLLALPLVPRARADVGIRLLKLTASADAYQDKFGMSVALSNDRALIGAPGGGWPVQVEGGAYVFDAKTGQQIRRLTASDGHPGNYFGWSDALHDNIALVGAFEDNKSAPSGGAAYLFDVNSGQQLMKLTATDVSRGDYFGWSVALSGNIALVGANSNEYSRSSIGSAYLFDVVTGDQLFKLTGSDTKPGDFFGSSVALSGNYAIVGADGERGSNYSGAAYVFDVTTGQQLFKLTGYDEFGSSVGVSGNTAIVGETWGIPDDFGASGAAHLFDLSTGQKLTTLGASDGTSGDVFGNSVAISGNLAVVGAKNDNNRTGSAYLFNTITGQQLAKLTAPDVFPDDQFGESVAVSSTMALVGTPYGYAGSAYLFYLVPEPSTLASGRR